MPTKNDTVTRTCMESCLGRFDPTRSGLRVCCGPGTMLRELADSGLEMVDCYRSDAAEFLRNGDLVTAFAAINYAHAWIGCFCDLGLFEADTGKELYETLSASDDGESSRIDDQKMAKYLDITTRARKKLDLAPPARSFDRRLAFKLLDRSDLYFRTAVDYRKENDYVRAFAAVNYAHAWLDAGARIGLFDVGGDDVLFTLYERP